MMTAVLIIGCGGEIPDNRPARTKASGTVTYNGEPVEGATVTLKPLVKGAKGAFGKTDANGHFELGTYEAADGAMPGEYAVTVKKIVVPESSAADSIPSTEDESYDGAPDAGESPEPTNELPEKYNDMQQSGFTVEIGEEPVTDLKFELTD